MLEAIMTQKQLRRFLEVMVDNLVDSNVFMRSLVLSVEHSAFRQDFCDSGTRSAPTASEVSQREQEKGKEGGETGSDAEHVGGVGGGVGVLVSVEEPCYLGHTWYDVQPQEVEDAVEEEEEEKGDEGDVEERKITKYASSKCRPGGARPRGHEGAATSGGGLGCGGGGCVKDGEEGAVDAGHCCDGGQVGVAAISPSSGRAEGRVILAKSTLTWAADGNKARDGFTRLQSFLQHNLAQLVRDLMGVVNLETINHENICCLNTAVLILIFADQRGQLAEVSFFFCFVACFGTEIGPIVRSF